jgi:hypothetical protein
MTFEVIITAGGVRLWAVDGYSVPEQVYDTLHPSKLFPADTGMTEAEALVVLDFIKSAAPPPDHRGPYIHTAITGAKPLRSDALGVRTKDIPAAMARLKKHGITGVRYDRVGRAVFADAGARRALMKLEGVRQMNSYYGA